MSDNNNYAFMKSGHNNLVQPTSTSEDIEYLIGTYASNALQHASLYIKHAKRSILTTEDMKRALMMETMCLKNRDMEKEIEKFKKTFQDMSDSSDEEEELVEQEEFTISECKCVFCKCMNNIYQKWESFSPNSMIEVILKKRIDEM